MRNQLKFIAASLLWAAAPASAEVAASTDGGFAVRETATISAPPLEVWSELIAPAHWWDKAHTWSGDAAALYLDPQASGCFCELLPKDPAAPEGTRRGSVEHMHVIVANPGKRLVMAGELGPLQGEAVTGKLTVTLTEKDGGTSVTWDYVVGGYFRKPPAELAPAVDQVLGEQLAHLQARFPAVAAVETPSPPPAP